MPPSDSICLYPQIKTIAGIRKHRHPYKSKPQSLFFEKDFNKSEQLKELYPTIVKSELLERCKESNPENSDRLKKNQSNSWRTQKNKNGSFNTLLQNYALEVKKTVRSKSNKFRIAKNQKIKPKSELSNQNIMLITKFTKDYNENVQKYKNKYKFSLNSEPQFDKKQVKLLRNCNSNYFSEIKKGKSLSVSDIFTKQKPKIRIRQQKMSQRQLQQFQQKFVPIGSQPNQTIDYKQLKNSFFQNTQVQSPKSKMNNKNKGIYRVHQFCYRTNQDLQEKQRAMQKTNTLLDQIEVRLKTEQFQNVGPWTKI